MKHVDPLGKAFAEFNFSHNRLFILYQDRLKQQSPFVDVYDLSRPITRIADDKDVTPPEKDSFFKSDVQPYLSFSPDSLLIPLTQESQDTGIYSHIEFFWSTPSLQVFDFTAQTWTDFSHFWHPNPLTHSFGITPFSLVSTSSEQLFASHLSTPQFNYITDDLYFMNMQEYSALYHTDNRNVVTFSTETTIEVPVASAIQLLGSFSGVEPNHTVSYTWSLNNEVIRETDNHFRGPVGILENVGRLPFLMQTLNDIGLQTYTLHVKDEDDPTQEATFTIKINVVEP
jgi:hypothetical protein